ncbi:hypothetical protein WJX72_010744 [[Myrmecia] bisecta]|uniref:Dynamin N-terminal domain-containing protein n=1 Tax=[Myrmecia] bisecta TaxID=41462 RepID=A0AAW1R9L8_9CHLO
MASGYAALYAEVGAVLEDGLGRLLGGLVDSPAGREGSAAQVLIDQELQRFYSQYRLLQQRHRDQTLSVAVLALTKSGKSTLLNALMGRVILPSNNVPETARISCITHTALAANEQPLLVVNGTSHYGDSNIRAQLQYLNQEVRLRAHRQSDEAFLDIRAPVAALSASESTPGVAFRLLDTPGPNEAGEEALKFQVERLLDGVDAVIYLLDYTKLKTQEEADTLRKLQDINPQLVKRLSQRLFFVVNKADQIGHTEGMEAEETRQYVADLVTRQMDCEDFQLDPDQVLLLSAQDALLSRLLLAGNPSPADKDRFLRIAFGKKAAKMASAEAECRKAAVEILEESGLPELESQVLGFLYTHSGALKLLAVLDDMAHMLHQVQNVAAASNAALRQDVASLQSEADVLQHQLERTLMQFEDISREAEQVEVEVVDEVQARMQRLKEHLFQHVSAVLDVTADPETVLPPARAGRWRAVWNKAVHFLSRAPQTPEQGPRDMQATLEELHNEIQAQIDAEVGEFWQQLERATNERQHTLFRRINTHLQALSQRIEAAVGEVLEVRLEPAHIRLEMPSAQDFHTSLQTLFAEGITFEERQRTREVEQSAVVWEKRYRHGLCRKGEYFVGRPVSRTVTETYTECVWELQPENIKYHFITMVDQTVDNSIKHVRAFVRQYLSCQVGEARARIEDYGERYTAAMLAVVGTSRQGEEHRLRALATVGHHLATVEDLLDDVATIQDHAQRLFPAAHSTPGQAGPGSSSFMSDDSLYGSMQRSDPAGTRTPVVDVRPLAGLTAMEPLKLGETEVASVRPLARLTATESLNLGETEVANVSPLAGLTGLHTLTAAELQQADHPAVLMAEEECEIVDVVFSDASASPTGYSSDAESTGWTVVPDHEDDRM